MSIQAKHINEWVVNAARASGAVNSGTIGIAMNPFGGYLSSAILGFSQVVTTATLTCSALVFAPLVKTNGSRVLNFGTAADIVTFTFGSAITLADLTSGLSVELGVTDIDVPTAIGSNTRYPFAGPTLVGITIAGGATVPAAGSFLGRFVFSRAAGRY